MDRIGLAVIEWSKVKALSSNAGNQVLTWGKSLIYVLPDFPSEK